VVGTFSQTERTGKLKKKNGWLFNNLLSKLLSLLIATTLWFFVVFENMPEVTFILPLHIKNQPRHMALVGDVEGRNIEVRLKGPQSIISGLTAQQVGVTVDLSGFGSGEVIVPLTHGMISVPGRVKIVGISPSSVIVKLEPITSRMVEVEPVILGVPADGYLLKEVRVFPEQVKVFGAKSVLEKLKLFYTDSVDIGGANKPLTAKVRITSLDKNIRLADSDIVEVRPIIVEKEIDQEFQAIPIIVIPAGMKAALNPDRINIVLHGIKSKLTQIKPEDLVATVNTLELPEDKNWIVPKISLPEGISLVKTIPEQIEVTAVSQEEGDELVRPKPGQQIIPQKKKMEPKPGKEQAPPQSTKVHTTYTIPLRVKNQPENLALATNMENINIEVRLEGPQTIVSGLSAQQQIQATVDLTGLTPGEAIIPLTPETISAPQQVKVTGISPSSVTLELESIISKMVKVQPIILGVPAEGYLLQEVRIFPEQVKILGTESTLAEINTLSTESVDIGGAKKSFITEVSIAHLEKDIRLDSNELIEIRPIIIEKIENREFRSIPIIVIPPQMKVKLDPSRIDVLLSGVQSNLDQIKPDDLVATINTDKPLTKGRLISPKLSLPEGISLVRMFPEQVMVKAFVIEKKVEREFPSIRVVVTPPGMRVMLDPPRVKVVLYGAGSELAKIKSENLVATINFHNLPQGEKQVTPNISLPEGISLVKMIPDKVQVNTVVQKENDKNPLLKR
jgi:YbbR domain-containing protein